jgi:hydroxymethylglutaryl-CoA reductase (NADPH)
MSHPITHKDQPIISRQTLALLDRLRASFTEQDVRSRLMPAPLGQSAPALRGARVAGRDSLTALWARLREASPVGADDERTLADEQTSDTAHAYAANIENMIGTVKVPVGVIGPLSVRGLHASGEFFVPLATTEAALVASYARGADIASRAGGVSAAILCEGVLRSPGFRFADLAEAGLFVDWVAQNSGDLKAAAEATTRHGKLVSIDPVMDNDIVFLLCRYTTGDASGQNMVTLATDALCRHIETHCPIRPRYWFVEANFSGDKKSTYLALLSGRGRKVTASVTIPGPLVEAGLHVRVERIVDYVQMASLGAALSGQLGAQGHYANGLAAFYIATGQDAACISESAVGTTRMENRGGDLFVSVTLPNILVGSVGGGTHLPSQRAALNILGLCGDGKAAALAEIVAALCLCGEISIIGAIAAGEFTHAHRKFARQR